MRNSVPDATSVTRRTRIEARHSLCALQIAFILTGRRALALVDKVPFVPVALIDPQPDITSKAASSLICGAPATPNAKPSTTLLMVLGGFFRSFRSACDADDRRGWATLRVFV